MADYVGMRHLSCRAKGYFLHAISTCLLLLFFQASSSPAHAVPIEQIQIGDSYFINNVFSDNDLVVVKQIDYNRNTIKVEYTTGGVDWVSPSKLLSTTQSRETDVKEGVVGTAVVVGALWAILDPDGFQDAINKQQSQSAKKSNHSSATTTSSHNDNQKNIHSGSVAITAVPFSPIVRGEWLDGNENWRSWAENKISSSLIKNVSIESVRLKGIPFYSSLSRDVFLIEAAETGRTGAYYIVHDNTAGNTTILLDGKGSSIHEINKEFNFYLNSSSQAVEYLEFFTSSISADGGIFLIIEPDEKYLSRSLINEIGISPTRVVSQTTNGWEIDADVIYDNYVFSAEFFVEKNGNVTMIDDKPKKQIDFDYNVVMDGSRRVYVSN